MIKKLLFETWAGDKLLALVERLGIGIVRLDDVAN